MSISQKQLMVLESNIITRFNKLEDRVVYLEHKSKTQSKTVTAMNLRLSQRIIKENGTS